jgi:spore coat polysaccharide biosynthesis protein SpsF (cytidylyltransferase family)
VALAIIQARYNSTRLPGKVLEHIGDHTVLEHVVRRVQSAVQDVVVATPNTPKDARIISYTKDKLRTSVYMHDGPENDVLGRYAACAREHKADVIIRITADCPFIDPAMIQALLIVRDLTGADYASNVPDHPQIDGLDCEVFTRAILERADREATDATDREHVTPWIKRHAARDVIIDSQYDALPAGAHRWTLDTEQDLAWLNMIANEIDCTPPKNVVPDLVTLLRERPELARYQV